MELPKYHEAFIPILEILNTIDNDFFEGE